METTEAHLGTMEAQLKQWGAKLDELGVIGEEAATEARVLYRKGVEDLKAKHKVAQSKLAELRAAGSDKWDTLKAGVDSAWSELEAGFKKLTNQ